MNNKNKATFIEDQSPSESKIKSYNLKNNFILLFIRRYIYPILNFFNHYLTLNKYPVLKKFNPNLILPNQRGNDYDRHRRRVNNYCNIKGKTILIIGVGSGKDLKSWVEYKPKKIIAMDIINYSKAWKILKNNFSKIYQTEVEFFIGNIEEMKNIESNSIDIVTSDAVFEHVNNFKKCLKEINRVLKHGGHLYSTFGPLWHSIGGDHISGNDHYSNGFNHLKLDKKNYYEYLESFGPFSHNEDDGRTWIYNNLFSYLKPIDYLYELNKHGFKKKFLQIILDERINYYKDNIEDYSKIKNEYGEENIIISGLSIIYCKD